PLRIGRADAGTASGSGRRAAHHDATAARLASQCQSTDEGTAAGPRTRAGAGVAAPAASRECDAHADRTNTRRTGARAEDSFRGRRSLDLRLLRSSDHEAPFDVGASVRHGAAGGSAGATRSIRSPGAAGPVRAVAGSGSASHARDPADAADGADAA